MIFDGVGNDQREGKRRERFDAAFRAGYPAAGRRISSSAADRRWSAFICQTRHVSIAVTFAVSQRQPLPRARKVFSIFFGGQMV
jgi:hypothetical protein